MTGEESRALRLLADAGRNGCTDAVFTALGFDADVVHGLVPARLAIATAEHVHVRGRFVSIVRVTITDAGRKALG